MCSVFTERDGSPSAEYRGWIFIIKQTRLHVHVLTYMSTCTCTCTCVPHPLTCTCTCTQLSHNGLPILGTEFNKCRRPLPGSAVGPLQARAQQRQAAVPDGTTQKRPDCKRYWLCSVRDVTARGRRHSRHNIENRPQHTGYGPLAYKAAHPPGKEPYLENYKLQAKRRMASQKRFLTSNGFTYSNPMKKSSVLLCVWNGELH